MLLCYSFNRVEASISCEVCEVTGEMKEPLKQCIAWLQAYFTEPQLMLKLPVPPFHHYLLEQGTVCMSCSVIFGTYYMMLFFYKVCTWLLGNTLELKICKKL